MSKQTLGVSRTAGLGNRIAQAASAEQGSVSRTSGQYRGEGTQNREAARAKADPLSNSEHLLWALGGEPPEPG